MRSICLAGLLHFAAFSGVFAQSWGTVTGRITEHGTTAPIPYATVLVSGTNFGTAADEDGVYTLPLPFGRHVLRYSAVGYAARFDTLVVPPDDTVRRDVALGAASVLMDSIVVAVEAAAPEAGVYRVDPAHLRVLPTAFRDGFRILKSMPGVTTNNELTNEYSVRGGSYNENLVFVNGYEVFKPFRTRKGEQEGLGVVNPDLAERLTFYTGGFPARYGGKLSSALDVVYRRPEREAITGNASVSLLDAALTAGASALGGRLGGVFGVRGMQARRFFGTQDLKGDYGPQFFDAQAALSYRLAPGHEVEALGHVLHNRFALDPESRRTYFGPTLFSVLEADFSYDGSEEDRYRTRFGGLRLKNSLSSRFRMEHDVSVFETEEQEMIHFSATTGLTQIAFNPQTLEEKRTPLGHFSQAETAHNRVRVTTWTGRGRYQFYTGRQVTEAGWSLRRLHFADRLFESEEISELSSIPDTLDPALLDSLFDLGFFDRPDTLITTRYQGTVDLYAAQAGGYLQSSFGLLPERDRLVVTLGARADHFSFNGEWTVSPRASMRFRLDERTTLTGS
jgi:hypothetical protein